MKVKTLNGNLNIIGRNLRKYRKSQKISQPELCKRIGHLYIFLLTFLVLPLFFWVFHHIYLETTIFFVLIGILYKK